jgi:hypothetical protein
MGEELGQRREQLLGRLLGDPVGGAGQNHALNVVRDELHRVGRAFAAAFLAADRQDGHGQPPRLPLFVLRGRRADGAVELKAAAQGFRVLGEQGDVIADVIGRQVLGSR